MKKIIFWIKNIPVMLKSMPKVARIASIIGAAVVVAGLAAFLLIREFAPTNIYGIDVSHYQGDISWKAISESGKVSFAYIKATEGSTYQDPNFKTNWESAAKYGITEGAYHFFVMTSSGEDQAQNYIATVPKKSGSLPPAIDIETSNLSNADFYQQLSDYITLVTDYYGVKPVLYVPYRVYNQIYDDYSDYTFWIIDDAVPTIKGWSIWQYSSKNTISGITGNVDGDVYVGSPYSFQQFLIK